MGCNAWRYAGLGYRRVLDGPGLALLGAYQTNYFTRIGRAIGLGDKVASRLRLRPRLLRGHAVLIDATDSSHVDIFKEIVVDGAYDLAKILFKPEMVIDCGGHIGLFMVLACSRYPEARTIVFEPLPRNLAYLKTAVRLNRIRVEVRHQAVSDRAGVTHFYERNSCGSSMAVGAVPYIKQRKVKMVDLPALLREWNPRNLLLKMDIEGEELTLLPQLCAILPAKCAIFFETHNGRAGWETITEALQKEGFQVELLRGRDPYRDGVALRQA